MYTHIRSANYVFSHYLPLWFIVFGHFALYSETLFNLTYLIVATTRTYIFIIWILNVFFAYWAPVQAHSFSTFNAFEVVDSGVQCFDCIYSTKKRVGYFPLLCRFDNFLPRLDIVADRDWRNS